jgi:hypothetical protein
VKPRFAGLSEDVSFSAAQRRIDWPLDFYLTLSSSILYLRYPPVVTPFPDSISQEGPGKPAHPAKLVPLTMGVDLSFNIYVLISILALSLIPSADAAIHRIAHDDSRISYYPSVCNLDCTRVCQDQWYAFHSYLAFFIRQVNTSSGGFLVCRMALLPTGPKATTPHPTSPFRGAV